MKPHILSIIFLFLFALFFHSLQAQTKQIDSLLRVLKTAKEDTNKARSLISLSGKLYRLNDYEKSKVYATAAVQLSEKINYPKGKIFACQNIANVYVSQGNYPEALKAYLTSLKTAREI